MAHLQQKTQDISEGRTRTKGAQCSFDLLVKYSSDRLDKRIIFNYYGIFHRTLVDHQFSSVYNTPLDFTLQLIFRKISDVQREKELNEMHRNQPPLSSLAPDHPVRRLISRFCNAASTTVGQTSSVSSSECRERGAESAASDVTGQTSTTVSYRLE